MSPISCTTQNMKHILLKGVERADAIGLGQTIVLAAVDDEHGSRPVGYEVDRVIPG